jgi:hypothetical protein
LNGFRNPEECPELYRSFEYHLSTNSRLAVNTIVGIRENRRDSARIVKTKRKPSKILDMWPYTEKVLDKTS